ncbi:hypothetical protein [Luteibacter sp.]
MGDLAELAKAIVQQYRNIDDVLSGRTTQAIPAVPVFTLVVTLEN